MATGHRDSLSFSSRVAYEIALLLFRTITSIFFREIRSRGAYNIPHDGPVILVVGPHHNQFLDMHVALEVHKETKRNVRFLVAAASMRRAAVGFFARLISSIPVERAQDNAKPSNGLISVDSEDPCLVYGTSTHFKTDLKPREQLMLPKSLSSATAEITEILSDTQLKIKREFTSETRGAVTDKFRSALDELKREGKEGVEFKRMPIVDQKEMFKHVYTCMQEGGVLGMFPEGGSHDRTDLLPLKAGVSLMALGAMANDPTIKVKIVPVGLSYFHPHRFRSRAVVEFGSALDIPPEFVQMFQEGGSKKREATGKLLDIIFDALKAVTVRAPDYETLLVCQAARRLYEPPGQNLSLGQVVELNKRFLMGYQHFGNEPRIQALRSDVLKYNRRVRDLGLRDHQVPRAHRAWWKTLGLFIYRIVLLAVWAVLALPGVAFNWPIFLASSVISKRKAKEALAKSNVKIAARDVMGTWKVLVALALTPALYLWYGLVSAYFACKLGASARGAIGTALSVIGLLPLVGYAALKIGEAGMDVVKSLPPLVIALVPGQQRTLNNLKQMRANLTREIADVVNDFGPQVWDDFDQFRMLPASGAPPAAEDSVLRQRKEGSHADPSLLLHPMSWVDDRLFGWSKSSRRSWDDGTTSRGASRAATPSGSDVEDEADWDHALGYLSSFQGTRSQPRSRAQSSVRGTAPS